jgi:hypothetical protein
MTTDTQVAGNGPPRLGAHDRDAGWELPELAPVALIVCVGLIVIGSAAESVMLLVGEPGSSSGLGWNLFTSSLRSIGPSTALMLLIATALLWWQYGYWSTMADSEVADDVIDVHVARLRTIAKWNLVSFIITMVVMIVLIVGSFLQNTYPGVALQEWAVSVETICASVGTLVLSLLGVVGLRRILAASREFVGEDVAPFSHEP